MRRGEIATPGGSGAAKCLLAGPFHKRYQTWEHVDLLGLSIWTSSGLLTLANIDT